MTRFGRKLTGIGLLSLFACGCTSVQPVAIGKTMAPEVTAISRASQRYPSFADIPAAPTDLRPLKKWGEAARAVEADRLALERATSDDTWSLSNTEAFVAKARSDAGKVASPNASTAAASDAFARELRRRATPPPPPKR